MISDDELQWYHRTLQSSLIPEPEEEEGISRVLGGYISGLVFSSLRPLGLTTVTLLTYLNS